MSRTLGPTGVVSQRERALLVVRAAPGLGADRGLARGSCGRAIRDRGRGRGDRSLPAARDRVKAIDAVVLRGGVEIENPLATALEFVEAYSVYDSDHPSAPHTFDESDLRLANRGGARISAVEIAAILERRSKIERALRSIDPGASLVGPVQSIPWG